MFLFLLIRDRREPLGPLLNQRFLFEQLPYTVTQLPYMVTVLARMFSDQSNTERIEPMKSNGRRFAQAEDGTIYDSRTGETLSHGQFVYVPHKSKLKENFVMTFQEAMGEIAKNRRLWGRPRAVLDCLMSHLCFENYILIPQSEIAEELELHRTHVSAAIKILLEEHGAIA